MVEVHVTAQTGFSRASATYASGRPGYPQAVSGWLRGTLGISAGDSVVDLGAGTGKFTACLARTGADVVAVEPVRPMLDVLRRAHPAVRTFEGSATQIPLADGSADAVFAAQAFHWFATREALDEIGRVLRPNGILGLVWNAPDETCDWVAALTAIMNQHIGDTPSFYNGQWRSVFPADGYSELQERRYGHAVTGDFESVVVDRVMSVSFNAALPDRYRMEVERQIRQLVHCYPELADKTDVTFPYQTLVAWAKKRCLA